MLSVCIIPVFVKVHPHSGRTQLKLRQSLVYFSYTLTIVTFTNTTPPHFRIMAHWKGRVPDLKVFLRVLRFNPIIKNQHFYIPNRSGVRGPQDLKSCITYYPLSIYLGVVWKLEGPSLMSQAFLFTWTRSRRFLTCFPNFPKCQIIQKRYHQVLTNKQSNQLVSQRDLVSGIQLLYQAQCCGAQALWVRNGIDKNVY